MDFWKSVSEAAETAKTLAKAVSKKGLELAETTAEEAGKKLKDLGLHEKLPSQEELEHFGITSDFQEFIRTLNYSTFRDFPPEHLVPLNQADGAAPGDGPAQKLNPWQEQHAKLVVQVVKEVNELRFVLCPRYMTDEHFWHVYFTIVKKSLPEKAFCWTEQDTLPTAAGSSDAGDLFSLSNLGSQLKVLGSRIQEGGRTLASGVGSSVELPPFLSSAAASNSAGAATGSAAADSTAASTPAAAAEEPQEAGGLEADPDLEAYLQVAINEGKEGSAGGEGDEEEEGNDEDLDLDSYINELSAEVDADDDDEDTK